MDDRRFYRQIDTDISPKERGQLAAARGEGLEECPYVEDKNIIEWQEGWRSKQRSIRRSMGCAE